MLCRGKANEELNEARNRKTKEVPRASSCSRFLIP